MAEPAKQEDQKPEVVCGDICKRGGDKPMQINDTLFAGVKIIFFDKEKRDIRGTMSVSFDDQELRKAGFNFVCQEQRIYTIPHKGTLFGIHFQLKSHPQNKIIHLLAGRGMDYIVDLRKASDTYKKWIAIELTGGDNQHIFIPQGYGHAFLSLEDNTIQMFTMSEKFHTGETKQINYKDAQLNLELPIEVAYISDYDKNAPEIDEENLDV